MDFDFLIEAARHAGHEIIRFGGLRMGLGVMFLLGGLIFLFSDETTGGGSAVASLGILLAIWGWRARDPDRRSN